MWCFILAGGAATRAWPYSLYMEKSMLRLAGKPIVRIIADRILATKHETADLFPSHEMNICILGQHMEDFRWEFRDLPQVKFSPKMEATGTASHYYYAAGLEQRIPHEAWVMIHYADCLTEIDYADFVKFAMKTGKDACIAVTANAKHDYSEIILDDDGTISQFNEKPKLKSPTWTGIACFKHGVLHDLLGNLLFGRKIDFALDVFPKLVAKNALSAYVYTGMWEDTGSSVGYNRLKEKISKGDIFV